AIDAHLRQDQAWVREAARRARPRRIPPAAQRLAVMQFEPLIGEWHGEGEIPMEPPMELSVEAKIERLEKFIVFSSAGEPADVPASVSIIGGAPGEDWARPGRPWLRPALHRRDLG